MAYSKERWEQIKNDPEWKRKNYEKVKEWRAANPGCRAGEGKRWRQAHPELYQEIRTRYKESHKDEIRQRDAEAKRKERAADPERQRKRWRREAERKLQKQVQLAGRERPDACEICGEGGKIFFDHCHQTGKFRGWICDRCNKTLGQVKDDPSLLRKLAEYLENCNGETDDIGTQEVSQGDVRPPRKASLSNSG